VRQVGGEQVSEFEVTDEHVSTAMEWLSAHPSGDYLDAAFATAWKGDGELGRSAWPVYVERVREAAELLRPASNSSRRGRGR
jgi:hypothetical protein